MRTIRFKYTVTIRCICCVIDFSFGRSLFYNSRYAFSFVCLVVYDKNFHCKIRFRISCLQLSVDRSRYTQPETSSLCCSCISPRSCSKETSSLSRTNVLNCDTTIIFEDTLRRLHSLSTSCPPKFSQSIPTGLSSKSETGSVMSSSTRSKLSCTSFDTPA